MVERFNVRNLEALTELPDFEPIRRPVEMQPRTEYLVEDNRHYSDKGNHKRMSDYHKGMHRLGGIPNQVAVDKTMAWNIRRSMLRTPSDGK